MIATDSDLCIPVSDIRCLPSPYLCWVSAKLTLEIL